MIKGSSLQRKEERVLVESVKIRNETVLIASEWLGVAERGFI